MDRYTTWLLRIRLAADLVPAFLLALIAMCFIVMAVYAVVVVLLQHLWRVL
jgi:hypothetical protein